MKKYHDWREWRRLRAVYKLPAHSLGGGLGLRAAVLSHDDLTVEVVADPVRDLRGVLQAQKNGVVRRPPLAHDALEGSRDSLGNRVSRIKVLERALIPDGDLSSPVVAFEDGAAPPTRPYLLFSPQTALGRITPVANGSRLPLSRSTDGIRFIC
jgi:hypothetical protein